MDVVVVIVVVIVLVVVLVLVFVMRFHRKFGYSLTFLHSSFALHLSPSSLLSLYSLFF